MKYESCDKCEELVKQIKAEIGNVSDERFFSDASLLLTLSMQNHAYSYIAAAHYYLGFYYFRSGALEQSIREALISMTQSEDHDVSDYYIRSCNLLGICYTMCLDYFSSLDYFLKAYYHSQETHNYPLLVQIVNNIGNLFFYLGDSATALPYYRRALVLDLEHGCTLPPDELCRINSKIIWCHLSLEQPAEAGRLVQEKKALLTKYTPDLLQLIQLTSKLLAGEAPVQGMIQQLLQISERSPELEQVFCAFHRIRDVVFHLNDMELSRAYLEHYQVLTERLQDYNYRINYYIEAIRYARMLPDSSLCKTLLEEYYELSQKNAESRRDTFLHSLTVKIDLERMIREREQLLKSSNRYRKLSELDGLTQIYNRVTAENKMRTALRMVPRDYISVLIMFDIDHFKLINDTYGHASGDFVLREVAACMQASFRKRDILGRFGGDEFAIFMRSLSDNLDDAKDICSQAISRLKKTIQERIPSDGPVIHLSIGVLLIPGPSRDFDKLYQLADQALYDAKNTGRNKSVFVCLPY